MFDFFKKKPKEITSDFDFNFVFNNDVEGSTIEELEIGTVYLPSGKIIVCDPLVYYNTEPLKKTVSSGTYPLKIYIARTEDFGDRYALAKLEFDKSVAVKWMLAYSSYQGKNILGFPVDAGLAGIFDVEAQLEYQKFMKDFYKKNPNGNLYDDFFAAEFKKNAEHQNDPNDIGNWINFTFPESNHNITMFQSGFGDGLYSCYWGMNKSNNIVSLVVDFELFQMDE
jgi:hypothetical protein